jgi:hypothetical protein
MRKPTILTFLAAVMLAIPAWAATTGTLADLSANQGSLTIGDKTFSNFSFSETGLTNFDPTKITVTASVSNGVYYLTWDGNMSLVTSNGSGAASADLLLRYNVTAAAGQIDAIDAFYTGSAQPTGGAFIAIDETARDRNGTVVGFTHLEGTQKSDNFPITPPQNFLAVTKDISFGIANGGFVTVSEIGQSFHQIPETGTVGLLVIGLGLLVLVRAMPRRRESR